MPISSCSSRLASSGQTRVRGLRFAVFSAGRPLTEALLDLTGRIYKDFRFDSKATNVRTTPEEVLRLAAGVCQDFAHLQVACLRSLGLAARYVSGYMRTYPPPGRPETGRRGCFARLGIRILSRHRLAGCRSDQ
jgi:transglutaminase-like putative cysteine protease